MDAYKSALKRALPPRPKLGRQLFVDEYAFYNHYTSAMKNAPIKTRTLLFKHGNLTDAELAGELVGAATIFPLVIDAPFSIEIECDVRPFRSEDINSTSGYLATVRVPYAGSEVAWFGRLDPRFDAGLNGVVGETRVRIRDVLQDKDPAPLEDYVNERLDAVRERLHLQMEPIKAINDRFERDLPRWVSEHAVVIEQIRSDLHKRPRRSAEG